MLRQFTDRAYRDWVSCDPTVLNAIAETDTSLVALASYLDGTYSVFNELMQSSDGSHSFLSTVHTDRGP